jgi:beta-phosphoglucomutase-like phosphatase (HAD superfamily)
MTSTPSSFDAVLFDPDGVLTATSALHAAIVAGDLGELV